MYRRYKENAKVLLSYVKWRPFPALREKFSEGYGRADAKADLMSGAVVGLVAIPLSMALAIASGVAPQQGLYTAIFAGFVVSLAGGSRFQVTGPTAAFVVILVPVVHKFGVAGLLMAGLMAGILLVLMGLARMGQLIQYIPHPVTTGFTSGIAVVIATIQLKDFFGLTVKSMPDKYFERVGALIHAAPTFSPMEMGFGFFTLAVLIYWPKVTKKVPPPLVALPLAAATAALIHWVFPNVAIATIGSRFSSVANGVTVRGIPQALPGFRFPWNFAGADGLPLPLTWSTIQALVPSAFAIAMLGAIESLLSAVVADGMGGTHHDPDAELVALGAGNLLCPFFGGIPATGAIARTAANIRFGAKSPLSSMTHAVFILLSVLLFAPVLSTLPMSAMAALLMVVAYNMSELRHFKHILRVAPRSDVMVLLLCFGLTVSFDMVIGVSVGVVIAALLFMRRMALVTTGRLLPEGHHEPAFPKLPKGVLAYEIAGPMFFGAVENAIDAIEEIGSGERSDIFRMDGVHAMDVTGLVAFESAIEELSDHKQRVFLVGVHPQPLGLLRRSDMLEDPQFVQVCKTMGEAVLQASEHLQGIGISTN